MVVKKIVARAIKHVAKNSPIVKKVSRKRKKHTPKYQDKKYRKKQLATKAQADKIKKAYVALKERQEGIDGRWLLAHFMGKGMPADNPLNVVRNLPKYTKKQIAEKRLARLSAIKDEESRNKILAQRAKTEDEFWNRSPVVMKSLSEVEKEIIRKKRSARMRLVWDPNSLPAGKARWVNYKMPNMVGIYFRDQRTGKLPTKEQVGMGELFRDGEEGIAKMKTIMGKPNPFYGAPLLPRKIKFLPKAHRPKLSKIEFEEVKKRYIAFKKIGVLKRYVDYA